MEATMRLDGLRTVSATQFSAIVVALDPAGSSDRAVSVAAELARLAGGRHVELVSVCPNRIPESTAVLHLEGLIAGEGLTDASAVVLAGDDPADAIASHLDDRDDALVLMATSAHGYLRQRTIGSVTQQLLGRLPQPILLIGPSVPTSYELDSAALIVCVDGTDAVATSAPAVARWAHTFGTAAVRLAAVSPIASGPLADAADAADHDDMRRWIEELTSSGVEAAPTVLHGGDPSLWLEDYAAQHDAILAVSSHRWADQHGHPHSTARRVVQRSTRPVLLIPVHEPVKQR